jgi:hypothetical protein
MLLSEAVALRDLKLPGVSAQRMSLILVMEMT